ncbi:hypothetical protein [Saccharopolyspora hattusasensis]|uniref:hypothetical protein n=1 Tax=Saccharopolyspora hattusasensis TaxID=1128679 RepID=UPI003D962A21
MSNPSTSGSESARQYGHLYSKTAHMDNPQLATYLVGVFTLMPTLSCGIAFHKEGCMEVTIHGAVGENSTEEDYLPTVVEVHNLLDQLGWRNPVEPADRRFDTCAVVLTPPTEPPPHLNEVLVTELPCPNRAK